MIEAYYDNAAPIVEDLEKSGVTRALLVELPDYRDHDGTNKTPAGVCVLVPLKPDGQIGQGRELVRQLRAWLDARKIPFLFSSCCHWRRTKHGRPGDRRRGNNAGRSDSRSSQQGRSVWQRRIHAQPDLMLSFQPGPNFGGCAVPTNQGDLVKIGMRSGAKLGNMANAWRAELVLEIAMESPSVPRDIWQPPGDRYDPGQQVWPSRRGRKAELP